MAALQFLPINSLEHAAPASDPLNTTFLSQVVVHDTSNSTGAIFTEARATVGTAVPHPRESAGLVTFPAAELAGLGVVALLALSFWPGKERVPDPRLDRPDAVLLK